MTRTQTLAMKKAESLVYSLSFEDCIILYNKLEVGHPMIDLVFDRMDTLDNPRFDAFLDS